MSGAYFPASGEDDRELRAILDIGNSFEIIDQMRVNYSLDLLKKVISGEDDYDYPKVVFYPLERSDGKSVVICVTLNIQPRTFPPTPN